MFLNFEIVSLLVLESLGLASSAAGYACLVTALCKLYNITGDTSVLARYENFGHLVAFYDCYSGLREKYTTQAQDSGVYILYKI